MAYTLQEFREWARQQMNPAYQIREEKNTIIYDAGYAQASVVFSEDIGVCELYIKDETEENTYFFLHFEPADEEHAKGLFREMITTLFSLKEEQKTKVLLCCTCGLTTGYFAMMLNEASAATGLDYEFSAVPYSQLYTAGFDQDVILIAPQIQYEYDKIRSVFRQIPVIKIPAAVFGGYKTGEMLNLITEELDGAKEAKDEKKLPALRDLEENEHAILTVSVLNNSEKSRAFCRIYDHSAVTFEQETVKKIITQKDITDMLSYILQLHPEVDTIGISIPGIAMHGTVDLPEAGFLNTDLAAELRAKYGRPVVIVNSVHAMALGYSTLMNEEDMVFLCLPRNPLYSGAGVIIRNMLRTGHMHRAGMISGLTDLLVTDRMKKMKTPEGCLEIVTADLLTYIAAISPVLLVVYCELVPDAEEIRKSLSRYVPENVMPKIVTVPDAEDYIFTGTLMRCMKAYTNEKWLKENNMK